MIKKHGIGKQWNVVWRFVAGLTSFKQYEGQMTRYFKYDALKNGSIIIDGPFFIQCLFEAKCTDYFNFPSTPATLTFCVQHDYAAFDTYALGYCISNFAMADSVHVAFDGLSFAYPRLAYDAISCFPWGLDFRATSTSVLNRLSFENCVLTGRIGELYLYPWQNLVTLCISDNCMLTNSDMLCLSELIPEMTSLKKLEISSDNYHSNYYAPENRSGFTKVLQQLAHSKVTVLNIAGSGYNCSHMPTDLSHVFRELAHLINPSSGKLRTLILEPNGNHILKIVSAHSSLKTLGLCYPVTLEYHGKFRPYTSSSLSDLNNNKCLTRLVIKQLLMARQRARGHRNSCKTVAELVQHNRTLLYLSLSTFHIPAHTHAIEKVISTLHLNTTLQNVELIVACAFKVEDISLYMKTRDWDPRITWKKEEHKHAFMDTFES